MTEQFAGFPVATQTRHFLVTYAREDDADAAARAQAIGTTCEQDLNTLDGWFACNFDSSPYGIWVHVPAGTHLGGASNTGYNEDESSRMWINGTYAPPNAPPNSTLRDEMARMIFVAELAEILMDFTASAWRRGDSMGEGLSILAAETLHPTGYYGTGQGPRINPWLQGARPDYVSANDGTDQNALSFGCAVLFLNYLRYQLGFSFNQIITAAGSVFSQFNALQFTPVALGDVLFKLTGRPAASAYGEFTALLQAHLPAGNTPQMPRDNVFPLRDPSQRRVAFSSAEDTIISPENPETLQVELQAGPLCPPKVYTYHNLDVSSQVTLAGRANGFALPAFTWTLNGVALIGSNAWRRTTVSMTATDTLPGIGEAAVVVDLPVQYLITSAASTSTLLIRNMAFPGNGKLDVTLSAVESLVAGDAPTTFADTTTLLTRGYKMLWPWAGDVAACNPKEVDVISNALRSLAHRLVEDENRPNPNPAAVRALANVARQYVEAMDVVTGGNRGLDLAVLSLAMELDPGPVSLGALTYNQIATGTRILSPLAEVPVQIALHTTDST